MMRLRRETLNLKIKLAIPLWRGITIYYSYGKKEWHMGNHTLLVSKIKWISYKKPYHGGWVVTSFKTYHTGRRLNARNI